MARMKRTPKVTIRGKQLSYRQALRWSRAARPTREDLRLARGQSQEVFRGALIALHEAKASCLQEKHTQAFAYLIAAIGKLESLPSFESLVPDTAR